MALRLPGIIRFASRRHPDSRCQSRRLSSALHPSLQCIYHSSAPEMHVCLQSQVKRHTACWVNGNLETYNNARWKVDRIRCTALDVTLACTHSLNVKVLISHQLANPTSQPICTATIESSAAQLIGPDSNVNELNAHCATCLMFSRYIPQPRFRHMEECDHRCVGKAFAVGPHLWRGGSRWRLARSSWTVLASVSATRWLLLFGMRFAGRTSISLETAMDVMVASSLAAAEAADALSLRARASVVVEACALIFDEPLLVRLPAFRPAGPSWLVRRKRVPQALHRVGLLLGPRLHCGDSAGEGGEGQG